MTLRHHGLKEWVQANREIGDGISHCGRLSLNFKMDVGSVKETVTISAEAEQLPTHNPAVGLLVTGSGNS